MTPHAATVRVLGEHGWNRGQCDCGHDTPAGEAPDWYPYDLGDHASHQADVLAAAGVLPAVQEWGVRYQGGRQVRADMSKSEAERWAEMARPRMYPDAQLVTRWTGATAWTAEEGL